MKKSKATQVMSAAAALALMTTSFGGVATVSASEAGAVPAFEDIEFPDTMPTTVQMAEDGYYAYDDMSVHYDLSFMTDNYGYPLPDDDPIRKWLEEKYNVTIKIDTVASTSDMENFISTSFAGGDAPDLFSLPSKEMGFILGEQGLLVDGKEMYPYMPQTCKYVTKLLINFSTMADGTIPFVTKYALSDSDLWNLAVRADWLENLGMEMPTNEEELLEYARACTFDDPDGNGVDDTYFTLGAGGGASFGMLAGFDNAYGNPSYVVGEDGKLSAPMLNGVRKQTLEFMNKIYSMGAMPIDWYSIDWEAAKAYTMNDRIGFVRYPVGSLYGEYARFHNDYSLDLMKKWAFLPDMPFENGKGGAGGKNGYMWAVPKANVEGDQGKLMRICHILDAMAVGGEACFATVRGGGPEVFPGRDDTGFREYTEDGYMIIYTPETHPGFDGTYGTDNLVLTTWQNFGYTNKYLLEYFPPEENKDDYVDFVNEQKTMVSKMERWDNMALFYTLPIDIQPSLNEFVNAQEFKFVTGERSFDEWDTYVQEWLNQGGRENCISVAEQLGCELPDGIE